MPADVAAAARESLIAATTAAHELHGPLGANLLDGARTAFTTGPNVVAFVGALLFACLAIVTAVALRRYAPAADDMQLDAG